MDVREFEGSPFFPAGLRLLRDAGRDDRIRYVEIVAEYLGLWARFEPRMKRRKVKRRLRRKLYAKAAQVELIEDHGEKSEFDIQANMDRLLKGAIEEANGNHRAAAELLGVDVKTLYNWRKRRTKYTPTKVASSGRKR